MEIRVAKYYFDVLRLIIEYILGENSFYLVDWFSFKWFGCWNFNILIFLPLKGKRNHTVPKNGRASDILLINLYNSLNIL